MPDKTLVILRLNAADMGHLNEAVEEVKGLTSGEVKDVRREPIGFGVEVIKAGVLISEKDENALNRLLAEIQALKSIESVEVEGMTLI